MKIHPLHNFVLVKRLASEHKTIAGVLIADAVLAKPDQGTVIAASAGTKLKNGILRPLEVKPGDNVLFGKLVGQPVSVDGVELLIMREDEIIAVVDV